MGEQRQIKLPFTILKLDEHPKIEFDTKRDSVEYSFKNFKLIKDHELLQLDNKDK